MSALLAFLISVIVAGSVDPSALSGLPPDGKRRVILESPNFAYVVVPYRPPYIERAPLEKDGIPNIFLSIKLISNRAERVRLPGMHRSPDIGIRFWDRKIKIVWDREWKNRRFEGANYPARWREPNIQDGGVHLNSRANPLVLIEELPVADRNVRAHLVNSVVSDQFSGLSIGNRDFFQGICDAFHRGGGASRFGDRLPHFFRLFVSPNGQPLSLSPKPDSGTSEDESEDASKAGRCGSNRAGVSVSPVANAARPPTENEREEGKTFLILGAAIFFLCCMYAAFELSRRPQGNDKDKNSQAKPD